MKTHMKTAIVSRWGTIDISDVPVPIPANNEALVRILYCGICGSDIHIYQGHHPTAKPPVPLGHEMVGIVERINSDLPTPYTVGDRVTIHADSCGRCDLCLTGAANECAKIGMKALAGDSEYMVAHIQNLIKVPDALPDQVAALLEPFACAVRTTDRAGIRTGDAVLVIGGGPIGMVSAMTAREMGASRVIISLRRDSRIQMAREYGFEVIDAEREDVVARVLELTDGEGVHATIETSCSASGVAITPVVTAVEGTIVMLAVGLEPKPVFDIGAIALKELKIVGSRAHTTADMRRAARLMESLNRKLDLQRLISDVIPLEAIEEGFSMMIHRQNRGKILVKIE